MYRIVRMHSSEAITFSQVPMKTSKSYKWTQLQVIKSEHISAIANTRKLNYHSVC